MARTKIDRTANLGLDDTIKRLEKEFGRGVVQTFDDGIIEKDIDVISTRSIGLDRILGIGGIPRGRIIEVIGPESSGKTSMCLHILAEAQSQGGKACFIDVEHALDVKYATNLGVDIPSLLISQPSCAEEALEILIAMVNTSEIAIVVLDSVAALVPRAELEGAMGDVTMGLQARLMGQCLRKLTGIVSKTNTAVIFINQIRQKIGVTWGSNETTPGGNALKFYSSVRIDFRKLSVIKDGDRIVGANTKAKIIKSKVSPPFGEHEFEVMFGKGINIESELLEFAVDNNLIEKSGHSYIYNGQKLGGSKDNAITFLRENPDMFNEIKLLLEENRYG